MTINRTYIALMILLVLTVGVSLAPLGTLGAYLSLLIATAKASLVLWVFMGVGREKSITGLIVTGSILWLVILFSLTLGDYLTRGSIGVLGK